MHKRSILAAVLVACISCGTAVADEVVQVRIIDYRFEPAELTVQVGTTVRWNNAERRTSHSILFLGEDGFESERIFPGEHWDHRFDQPGIHVYGCGPHEEMRGTVVVIE
jgi:plastocyanin